MKSRRLERTYANGAYRPLSPVEVEAELLRTIDRKELLTNGGVDPEDGEIIVQIHPKEYEVVPLENFEEIEQRKYSSTLLVFYVHKQEA